MRNPHKKGTIEYHAHRGLMLQHAATCRQLYKQYNEMDEYNLFAQYCKYLYLISDTQVKQFRPTNIQKVDIFYYRMISTILRKRGYTPIR